MDCEQLNMALLQKLDEIECSGTDIISCATACLKACENHLHRLRQWINKHKYTNQHDAIHFFKCVKSFALSKNLYYHKLLWLHLECPPQSESLQREYFEQRQKEIGRYFSENRHHYEYYRTKETGMDEFYFLPERYNCKHFEESYHIADPQFSTNFDGKLAEIMAQESLLAYIEKQLNPGTKEKPIVVPRLTCTASATDITELGNAFFACGIFPQATLREIMETLSFFMQKDLSDHYNTFSQIRERKINRTKFMDQLLHSLIRRMDQLDEK
jgi:RteC protein